MRLHHFPKKGKLSLDARMSIQKGTESWLERKGFRGIILKPHLQRKHSGGGGGLNADWMNVCRSLAPLLAKFL